MINMTLPNLLILLHHVGVRSWHNTPGVPDA